jgi:hypothetical protein
MLNVLKNVYDDEECLHEHKFTVGILGFKQFQKTLNLNEEAA